MRRRVARATRSRHPREAAAGDRARQGPVVVPVEEHAAGEPALADFGLGVAVHPAARLGGLVTGRPRDVLALQRLVGNAAVQRLLTGEVFPAVTLDRRGRDRSVRRFFPSAGPSAMSGNIGRAGLQRQAGEPLLRIGSRSPAVTELQQALAAAGFPLAADGIFGPGTRSAVVAFQRSVGLAADGVVGPKTWQGLKSGGGRPTAAGGGNPQHALLVAKLGAVRAALGLKAKGGAAPAGAGPGPSATGETGALGSLPGKAIPLCGPQLPAVGGAAPQAAPAAAGGPVQLQRSFIDDAASWWDETTTSVGEQADAASEWIGEQAEAAGSWVDEQVAAVGEQVDAAGEWVSEQAGAAGNWVGQQVEDAQQAATEAVQTVESAVGAGVATVVETASQLGQDVQALGDDLRKRYAKEIAIVEQVIQELGKPFGAGLDVGGLLRQMDDVLKQLGGADPKAGFFGLFEPEPKPPSKVYGLIDFAATIQQGGVKVPTTGYSEPKFSVGNITWWRVDDETVVVQATLNVDCRWDVAAEGRGVSISGPDDPAVTEISYQTVVNDLKQLRQSYLQKGVATTFWARQLVERHEVFHCHDYITRAGNYLSTAQAWLEEQTVSEDPDAGDTESQLKALLEAMRKKVEADNLEYFNNGGEERAFGDGLGSYDALIAGICARAKKAKWKGCNDGHCGGE